MIAAHLEKEGVKFEILNAKNNEREAAIIAKAGEKGAITLATNMAGRGTDIKLAKGVKELGGWWLSAASATNPVVSTTSSVVVQAARATRVKPSFSSALKMI